MGRKKKAAAPVDREALRARLERSCVVKPKEAKPRDDDAPEQGAAAEQPEQPVESSTVPELQPEPTEPEDDAENPSTQLDAFAAAFSGMAEQELTAVPRWTQPGPAFGDVRSVRLNQLQQRLIRERIDTLYAAQALLSDSVWYGLAAPWSRRRGRAPRGG